MAGKFSLIARKTSCRLLPLLPPGMQNEIYVREKSLSIQTGTFLVPGDRSHVD